MQISIRYFTTLREITGKKEEKLIFSENKKITITAVLETLSDKYGKAFTDYVFNSDEQVKSFLQLLINGTNTTTISGTEAAMQDGDVLAILPPVGGG
ncbi:MAG: MoaD/ThiS family protein [Candidatus Bathyarchaeota archaeon]|nr:MoaD/ThiS family protein [Candidatus Termiticorpusculum sp.]